jgi:hypothetical protein
MSERTLEERVAALEGQMTALTAMLAKSAPSQDWRSTVGMFSGNQAMKVIDAAGQAIRERERKRARQLKAKRRRIPA